MYRVLHLVYRFLTAFCCLLCWKGDVLGQAGNDQDVIDSAYYQWFSEISARSSLPYEQGVVYRSSGIQTAKNHQYFKSLGWADGCLTIDGSVNCGVKMLYNIMDDVLVVLNLKMEVDGVKSLKIDQASIDSFSIHDEKFVNYRLLPNPPVKEGFYQIVYQGTGIGFYVKHRKRKDVTKESIKYPQWKSMYFVRNDEFIAFKNKKSILNLYPKRRQEVKKLMLAYCPQLKRSNLMGLTEFLSVVDGMDL